MAKKIILMIMMIVLITTVGCGKSADKGTGQKANPKTIEITEDMYVQWINEITANADSYIGDRVQLEGLYMKEGHADVRNRYSYVYRHGLGCCSTDGGVFGFEYIFEDEAPADGSWIEVTGILSSYDRDGEKRLVIKADSVELKEEYGEVFVTQ